MDNENINENLESRLSDIRNLYQIINNVKNEKKKFLLKHKMQTEMDFMIDRIEEYYYKHVLKNKKEDKIKSPLIPIGFSFLIV